MNVGFFARRIVAHKPHEPFYMGRQCRAGEHFRMGVMVEGECKGSNEIEIN